MPITADEDDWDEEATLTFAERRLMFERGLITQSQVRKNFIDACSLIKL